MKEPRIPAALRTTAAAVEAPPHDAAGMGDHTVVDEAGSPARRGSVADGSGAGESAGGGGGNHLQPHFREAFGVTRVTHVAGIPAPVIVFAAATTGIPGKPPGYSPAVIELAAVLVLPDGKIGRLEKGGAWASLIKAPLAALTCEQAQEAGGFHEIGVAEVLAAASAAEVAASLRGWLGRIEAACARKGLPPPVSATFGQDFFVRALDAAAAGPQPGLICGNGLASSCVCLMTRAAKALAGGGRGQKVGLISLSRAHALLVGEGAVLARGTEKESKLSWSRVAAAHGGVGSALPQADRAAQVLVGLRDLARAEATR